MIRPSLRLPALLAVGGCLALLTACTPWPRSGYGGEAEAYYRYPSTPPRDYAGTGFSRLSCQSTRIETLRLVGAETLRPGLLRDANEAWARAARAMNGGLYREAYQDLDKVDDILQELASQLGGLATERARQREEWQTKGCPL